MPKGIQDFTSSSTSCTVEVIVLKILNGVPDAPGVKAGDAAFAPPPPTVIGKDVPTC
jgi:hypothetical protein